MRHEKVIKDERGTVKIVVNLVSWSYGNPQYRYDVDTWVTKSEKIGEVWAENIATPSEILEAKLELWNKIKPC